MQNINAIVNNYRSLYLFIVLLVLTATFTVKGAAQEEGSANFLKPGEVLDTSGNAVPIDSLASKEPGIGEPGVTGFFKALPNPLFATKNATKTWTEANSGLQDKDRAQLLETLFLWPQNNYAFFFFSLASPVPDIAAKTIDYLQTHGTATGFPYNPYAGYKPSLNGSITCSRHPNLQGMKKPDDEICILISAFSKPLPVLAAQTMACGFNNGFVARVVLGELLDACDREGLTSAKTDMLDISNIEASGDMLFLLDNFTKSEPYGDKSHDSFVIGINALEGQYNLEAAGMLFGWQAASRLFDEKSTNPQYLAAAEGLIWGRFSNYELGLMTSYTLNYMWGFSNAAAARNYLKEKNQQEDIKTVLSTMSREAGVASTKSVLSTFYDLIIELNDPTLLSSSLTDEATAGAQLKLSPNSDPNGIAAHFPDFVRGALQGSLIASEKSFKELFKLGYELGYKDGFKDGYTAGYRDGWRDGYSVGYETAWKEATVVINGLQSELDNMRNELNRLKNAANWVDRARKVVSIVGALIRPRLLGPFASLPGQTPSANPMTTDECISRLSTKSNNELSDSAKEWGEYTTLGKQMLPSGLPYSWELTRCNGKGIGKLVRPAAHSTDEIWTLDVQLLEFAVDGKPVQQLDVRPRYIRLEVLRFPLVLPRALNVNLPPSPAYKTCEQKQPGHDQVVAFSGPIFIDYDPPVFLEVHPVDDLKIL